MALFLIYFSYMMNFIHIGAIVLLLHDPGDVILITARSYTDYKNMRVAICIIIYLILYAVWVYTRNIVFPLCAIKSAITQ